MIDCVLRNDDHVLHELLSKRVHIADTLRTRCHDRTIPENKGHLAEKNFITSMLYKIYFNFNLLQILTDVPLRFDNCFFYTKKWNGTIFYAFACLDWPEAQRFLRVRSLPNL